MNTALRRQIPAHAGLRKPLEESTAQQLQEATQRATAAFGSASTGDGNVLAALQVAEGIADLRELFDQPEIQARVVALQDTAIGFRTDRDPKVKNRKTGESNVPYSYDVVKDCAIEAALRGLQLVGNQFNIISGRMYATKEGFEFLIRRLTQVADFKMSLGVPAVKPGGVIIECEATWNNSGKAQSLKASIPVKSDDYSGADQLLGKATRKFLKRCYEVMTGNVLPEGEADEPAQIEATGPTVLLGNKRPAKFVAPDPSPTQEAAPVPAPAAATVKAAEAPVQAAPATQPDTQLVTPQDSLADAMVAGGVNFDLFKRWADHRGIDMANVDSFAEVPDATANRLLRSIASFVQQAKTFGEGGR